MNVDAPSTDLLTRYRAGDQRAADELFRRYLGRLTVLARARLSSRIGRRVDPEDIVHSAYRSFFLRARDGRLTLEKSGDLWRLLVSITLNKLHRVVAHHQAQRRSVNREVAGATPDSDGPWTPATAPRAEEAVALADLLETVLAELEPQNRTILELRLQEYDIAEIATVVKRSERTVRRGLQQIQAVLSRLLPADANGRFALRQQTNGELQASNADAGDPVDLADHPAAERLSLESTSLPLATTSAVLTERDVVIQLHLGTGGIGRVYRAWQKSEQQTVAVKFLRKALQRDVRATERFLREAETLSFLRHPGIVALRGVGRMRQGSLFLVMDFIDGPDLARVLADGPLSPMTAARYVARGAEAVQYAHDWGVIHCDLKPANLLLDSAGEIHVTDFGLAARLRSGTKQQGGGGTLGYMAPEQLDPAWGPIGPATDVFGLGAVLATLLTGHAPAASATVGGSLQKILRGGHLKVLDRDAAAIPPELLDVCRRCLAPSARDRMTSAAELAKALKGYLVADGIPQATSHRLDER